MLNLRQWLSEAREAGISLKQRLELDEYIKASKAHIEEEILPVEHHPEDGFRTKVAAVLTENKLVKKASRYLECSRFGYCLQCDAHSEHSFFSPFYCGLRFCARCGSRSFARLFQKYVTVFDHIQANSRRGYLIRKITITSTNVGTLTTEQIKKFNKDVKRTLKELLKGVEGWGALWCDEVGFNNYNLHAHILFYGPYIAKKDLGKAWKDVSGDDVVWISRAESGPKALSYMLKYVSKPPSDDPEIVGRLEVAFHGRRRVHGLGLFYAFTGKDPDHLHSEWTKCPKCGSGLHRLPGTQPIEDLISNGHPFIGEFRPERKMQKWVN